MAQGFRRTRKGITASFDPTERRMLLRLLTDVHDLLDDAEQDPAPDQDPLEAALGFSSNTTAPDDPALARLLPDGHCGEAEAASDFRRYTERGLRETKRAQLETARLCLGRSDPLVLTEQEAQAWLRALTDVRLVLGERLELKDDDDLDLLQAKVAGAPAEDSDALMVLVYDFLTWLQETLAGVLLAGLPEQGRQR